MPAGRGASAYGSHSLLPVVVTQHLLASEVKHYNQACRTILKENKSRDKKRNLETGRRASSEVRPETERP